MSGASLSKFAKLLTDTSGASFDTSSTPLVFISDGLRATTQRAEDEGLRGTRSRNVSRIAQGLIPVAGAIVAEPSPTEWDFWLQLIAGGTKSGTSIPLAETLQQVAFSSLRGPKWFQYDGCVCGTAEISSAGPGRKLSLSANILGQTETIQSTSFPSVAYDTQDVYMHHQLAVTLGGSVSGGTLSGGTTYQPERASVKIDNAVQVKYRNSQTATALVAGDRMVDVSLVIPFTSAEAALYASSSSAFAAQLVWTMGGLSLTMVFPALIAQTVTPVVGGGTNEITLELNCRAYKSGNENEIQIFNVSSGT